MTISATKFFVDPVAGGAFDGNFEITVMTDFQLRPNESVFAWVGTQPVDMIRQGITGNSLKGFVPNQPDPGDTLSVQIGLQERVDTGLTATSDDPGPNT